MAPKGVGVHIYGDWDGSGVKRATRDLSMMEKQAKGFSSGLTSSFTGMGTALGGAIGGAIALQSLVTFLKDSAQAAMDDQKSMVALATAMENVGLSAKNAEAEGLINSMSLQYGIADDQLRPAYQKLVTATRDVAQAQGMLQTAMDLSAAGYGDLEGASKALSAAAMGNFTALQRLKVPIDANIIKAKDFDGAMQALNKTVGGQAAAAAETYQGKMDRLTVSVGEAKEAIGYALLNALDNVSEAFGGVGGAQGAIKGFGEATANFVTGVGVAVTAMAKLTSAMVDGQKAGTDWGDVVRNIGLAAGVAFPPFMLLVGAIEQITDFGDRYTKSQADSANKSRGLTSATVQMARAMGDAKAPVNDLTDGLYESGLAAMQAASSFEDFWKSAANLSRQQQVLRDLMNTSGTVGSTLLAEALKDAGKSADVTTRKLDGLNNSSGGATSATKELSAAQQAAADRAQALQQNTESLATTLQGLAEEISPTIASAATATFDSVNAQIEKFKSTLQEARQFAQGIVDGFMGQLDLSKALEDSKNSGSSLVEAFVAQGDKVVAFGEKVNYLVQQGLKKPAWQAIMSMSYERGSEMADRLAEGNVAGNIASINKVYESVQTMAEQVAEAAASAFYDAGLKSMMELVRAMVEALSVDGKGRKKIMKILDDLAEAMYRKSYIDVEVRGPSGDASNWFASTYPGVATSFGGGDFSAAAAGFDWANMDLSSIFPTTPMFAEGGIATRATPGIFGEAGPEALIPLDRLGDFGGGNSYSITVNAGVGDPRAIGKSVVEAITLFERSSGPVFARA